MIHFPIYTVAGKVTPSSRPSHPEGFEDGPPSALLFHSETQTQEMLKRQSGLVAHKLAAPVDALRYLLGAEHCGAARVQVDCFTEAHAVYPMADVLRCVYELAERTEQAGLN